MASTSPRPATSSSPPNLRTALTGAEWHLQGVAKVWVHGETAADDRERIDLAVDRLSPAPLNAEAERPVALSDRALLIYTSGTTGLPKAAQHQPPPCAPMLVHALASRRR